MLLCYNYFKKIRNCIIHNNGIADSKAVDAYRAYAPISSATDMRTKETILHFPVTLGDPAKLSLRGVVGFCDIILRIMTTIDIELSRSRLAEQIALERLTSTKSPRLTLNSQRSRWIQQINGICTTSVLPKPANKEMMKEFMIDNKIVGR
jgi:hypothetical protein